MPAQPDPQDKGERRQPQDDPGQPVTEMVETAMSMPTTRAPPSPMKIFAGCQLKGRKPAVAPSSTAMTSEARLNAVCAVAWLLDASPNTREQDEDWNVEVPVIFEPDGRLNAAQKAIIETDFGMTDGQLVVASRKALVKYVLRRYQVDPRNQATNPEAQQIVVSNIKELRPWLMHD